MQAHAPRERYFLFLCGPITGLAPHEATSWRQYVMENLPSHVIALDPTRDAPEVKRQSASEESRRLSLERLQHGKAVATRDRFDVARCDLLIANFLGAKAISIGAVGEIFWADAMRKPVIIVREEDNQHNHDMLNEIAGWIFDNLDDALAQVRRICVANYSQG